MRLRISAILLLISSAALLVYLRALFFGYTYLDDNVLVLDNLAYLRNPAFAIKAFTTDVFHMPATLAAYYRPVLTLSFMWDAMIGGGSPWIYHLTNVLLHAIASCLVFFFLSGLGVRRHASFVLSLVFAVHPLFAQAVAWIPGRNDSLLGIFAFGGFVAYMRFMRTGHWGWFLAHAGMFLLGIFTKESMIFLPALATFYATGCWSGTPGSGRGIDIPSVPGEKVIKRYLLLIAVWAACGMVWFLLRHIALERNPLHYASSEALKSLLTNSPALLLFVGKFFLPWNLSVLPILRDSNLVTGAVVSAILAATLVVDQIASRRAAGRQGQGSRPRAVQGTVAWIFASPVILGLCWFAVFLFPSFIRPNAAYPADFLEHRAYVPIAGILLILGTRGFMRGLDLRRRTALILWMAIVAVLGALTFFHLRHFRDRISFWQNAAQHSPSHPLAHKNLGAMYYLDGNHELAEKEYIKALALYPHEMMVHNNLGLIYQARKEYQRAEEEYRKELEINPTYDNAYFNYGLLCYLAGRKKDAEMLWLETVRVNPIHQDAHRNLSVLYLESGDTARAQAFLAEAVKVGQGR